jgi:hypothetical protein
VVYSEAGVARAVADEYDQLLIQIGAIGPAEAKSAGIGDTKTQTAGA